MNAKILRTLAALSTLLGLSCSRSPEAPTPIAPAAPRPELQPARPAPSAAAAAAAQEHVHEDAPRPDVAQEPGISNAAFEEHVRALKLKLDRLGGRFTVIVEPPFGVIGDDEPAAVRASAERTVRWTTAKLKQDYFTQDPPRILDVWLFKDAASYFVLGLSFP